MKPKEFSSNEDILSTLSKIIRVHQVENLRTVAHIFYDVIKIAHYAVKRKQAGLSGDVRFPVVLSRKEVTGLVSLIDYHHSNDRVFRAEHELIQCFGPNFTEGDALKFFENFVEGDLRDKFGRNISIDLDDGVKFMYKNPATGLHEIKPEHYLPNRGKRLPWIKHALTHTTNIYTKIDKDQRELMYVAKYDLPPVDGQIFKCYWVVIAKKYKKDAVGKFKFKTAFPVMKYNELLKRLERYQPVTEALGV